MTMPSNPSAQRLSIGSLSLAIASALMTLAAPARAQSLVSLYESARTFDASYQSAKLQYDASVARADQAKAGILPSAGVSAGLNRNAIDYNPPPFNTSFNSQNGAISITQPLYRPANWATYKQGFKQMEQARALLDAAEQDLIVRTSQAYFDVLAAQDTLTFVRAQKEAVAEQLASAKRNFEVGTATITDTREAQARYDLVFAQEIAAVNDLQIRKITLDQLVGATASQPRPLRVPVALPPLVPADINAWVQQSDAVHPSIRLARDGLDIAELEVSKAEAGHKPTVDATASYSVSKNPANSPLIGVSSTVKASSIGVVLNVPLFAGFSVQNRIRETLSLRDKASSDLEGARRSVAQGTRTAYLGLLSGQSQVKALEAAELSSQVALDANKLGYQVGVRINIDVLNAQSQLYQTKRDLAQARYNVLLGGLRLRQANGTLTPEDLQQINGLLVP